MLELMDPSKILSVFVALLAIKTLIVGLKLSLEALHSLLEMIKPVTASDLDDKADSLVVKAISALQALLVALQKVIDMAPVAPAVKLTAPAQPPPETPAA